MTDAARIATRVVLPFALGVAGLLGAFAGAATYVLDRAPDRREAVRVAPPLLKKGAVEEWPDIRDGVPALKATAAKAEAAPQPQRPNVELAAKSDPAPKPVLTVAVAAPAAPPAPAEPPKAATLTPVATPIAAPARIAAAAPVVDVAVPLPPAVPVAAVPPAQAPRPVAAPAPAEIRPALPVTAETAQAGQTASVRPPPTKPVVAAKPAPAPVAQAPERKPRPERSVKRKEPTREAAAQPAAAPQAEASKGFDLGLPDLAATGKKIRENVEAFGSALMGGS